MLFQLEEGVPADEVEISGAERYDIAQLLARESLLKYVQELFEEENETFYKVQWARSISEAKQNSRETYTYIENFL